MCSFLSSLITNLLSNLENSKWWIQYDGKFLEKIISVITDYESAVRFEKLKIADQIRRTKF